MKELLKLEVVRPSDSKFNSLMLVVTKKDRGVQIMQEFCAINQQIMEGKYLMREVQKCIDKIEQVESPILFIH